MATVIPAPSNSTVSQLVSAKQSGADVQYAGNYVTINGQKMVLRKSELSSMGYSSLNELRSEVDLRLRAEQGDAAAVQKLSELQKETERSEGRYREDVARAEAEARATNVPVKDVLKAGGVRSFSASNVANERLRETSYTPIVRSTGQFEAGALSERGRVLRESVAVQRVRTGEQRVVVPPMRSVGVARQVFPVRGAEEVYFSQFRGRQPVSPLISQPSLDRFSNAAELERQDVIFRDESGQLQLTKQPTPEQYARPTDELSEGISQSLSRSRFGEVLKYTTYGREFYKLTPEQQLEVGSTQFDVALTIYGGFGAAKGLYNLGKLGKGFVLKRLSGAAVKFGLREAEAVAPTVTKEAAQTVVQQAPSRLSGSLYALTRTGAVQEVKVGARVGVKPTEQLISSFLKRETVKETAKVVAPKVPSALSRAWNYAPKTIALQGANIYGLSRYNALLKRTFGEEEFKTGIEARDIVAEARGQQYYEYDKEGKPVGVLKRQEEKAPDTFRGQAKQVAIKAGQWFKYDVVSQTPLIGESLRFFDKGYSEAENRAIRDIGRSKGKTEAELDQYVRDVKKVGLYRSGGEFAALSNVEFLSERFGLRGLATVFSKKEGKKIGEEKITRKLASFVASPFARFGAIEGGSGYLVYTTGREKEFKPSEFALSAIGGATVSTLLGTGTVAFAPKSPFLSRTFSTVGTVLDAPFEPIGDFASKQATRLQRLFGREVLEPTVQPVFEKGAKVAERLPESAPEFKLSVFGRKSDVAPRGATPRVRTGSWVNNALQDAFGSGKKGAPSSAQSKGSQQLADALSKEQAVSESQQKAQVNIQTNIRSRSRNIASSLFTPSKTPEPVPVEEPTETPVEEPTKQDVFGVEEPAQEPTPVTTPVQSLVNLGIPVSTNVFAFRGLLPLPLPFPMGRGGGGQGRSGKLFANELLASQSLFKQQLGFDLRNLSMPVKRASKRGSKGKKGKKDKKKETNTSKKRWSFGF